MRSENLTWQGAPGASSLARASTFLLFAFFGIESALVPSGEVRDPPRTVPRAIGTAMVGVVVLYLAIQLVTQGILGASLAGRQTPLADAAGVALGPWGRQLILVGATISMFGYVSGMILAAPRMLFAFARDGFLPSGLARVHERFHTPHVAIVMQTAIVITLAASGTFEQLALVANGAVLLVYAACCLAVIELRRRDVRGGGAPFRVRAAAPAPILATLAIAWLLTGLTPREWIAIGAVLAIGAAVYAATIGGRRAVPAAASE